MALINGMVLLRNNMYRSLGTVRRQLATERTNYLSVTTDDDFGGSVAIVKMQKKPVNSLCADHWKELIKTIKGLENNDNARALIITSAFPGIFCAGLELTSIYGKTEDEIYQYWKIIQEGTLAFYSTPLITISAMNGHCLAGGCGIALASDYRVMAEGHLIGMNEAKLGLPVPIFLKDMTEHLIGFRETAKLLQLAKFIKSDEALKLGMLDEVVPMEQVLPTAKAQVAEWLEIPDHARAMIKEGMLKKAIKEFVETMEPAARFYAKLVSSEGVQANIKNSMQQLKKKKPE